MAAPTQLAFRSLKTIGILDAAPVYEPLSGFARPEGGLRCSAYSPCGRYFAWASLDAVIVVDASVGHVVTTLPADNVFELGFSPLGTYIITWQRPSKDENGDAVKNLKVWRVIEAAGAGAGGAGAAAANGNGNGNGTGVDGVVGRFVQKSQTGWNLQYTADEAYCARAVSNEIQFYRSDNLSTVWNKLRVEGVMDFALSPGKSHSIAVFVPERKGQPAAVKVFMIPQFGAPVSQKSFFKGDKVQLKWNASGTTLIVLAQTEVDKTGKSYYGETTMYLLSANGGFDSRIDLDKEGPIHDVSWSPNSKEFGVVYGYVPTKTTIFNFRGVAKHSFALAPRNTILFSPSGRFVLVAGFGNLAGQMDIYDMDKAYAKIATIEASNASVCEWSPDGRYILTATTSPRLRVDNGIRVWHVTGALMYNQDIDVLYDVSWRPNPAFQTAPPGDPLSALPAPHDSAIAYLATKKTPAKPAGAYRPPGARGQVTPLAFKREDEGGATFVREKAGALPLSSLSHQNGLVSRPRRREVPGAELVVSEYLPPGAAPGGGVTLPSPGGGLDPSAAAESDRLLSKAAAKNKRKREARLRAKESNGKDDSGDTQGGEGGAAGGRAEEEQQLESSPQLLAPSGATPSSSHDRLSSRSPDRRAQDRSRSKGRYADSNVRSKNGPSFAANGTGRAAPAAAAAAAAAGAASAAAGAGAATATATATATAADGPASAQDKKIRGLLKKMRAIDELKMRLASGEKLEDTQMKKIQTEDAVRRELDVLGYAG